MSNVKDLDAASLRDLRAPELSSAFDIFAPMSLSRELPTAALRITSLREPPAALWASLNAPELIAALRPEIFGAFASSLLMTSPPSLGQWRPLLTRRPQRLCELVTAAPHELAAPIQNLDHLLRANLVLFVGPIVIVLGNLVIRHPALYRLDLHIKLDNPLLQHGMDLRDGCEVAISTDEHLLAEGHEFGTLVQYTAPVRGKRHRLRAGGSSRAP